VSQKGWTQKPFLERTFEGDQKLERSNLTPGEEIVELNERWFLRGGLR